VVTLAWVVVTPAWVDEVGPMRVLMIAACPFPARRGTPLRVERLAEALVTRGHDVRLVAYHISEENAAFLYPVERIFNRTVSRPLPPGPTLAKLLLYDPALAYRVASTLNRWPADIMHAHHCEGVLAAAYARWRYRVPLVFDAHTLLASELPSYKIGFSQKLSRHLGAWLDGLLSRRADHTLAVTDDIRQHLISKHGIDSKCVSVATNGVEFEPFVAAARLSPDPGQTAAGRPLIYTGTLAPYQGVDLLLRAFAVVRRMCPDIRLEICTSSPFAPWAPLASELGISGAIDLVDANFQALPQRLADAGIALLPRPVCAGIPQKLLNYMAAGRPIVAFAGSAKTLVHEQTGLVVPGDDHEAFAAAILRLLQSPELATSLGTAAQSWVVRNCSWARTAASVEAAYEQLLPPDSGGKERISRWHFGLRPNAQSGG
jgi:glycosyltransferase involved in cell wall biosynthesis